MGRKAASRKRRLVGCFAAYPAPPRSVASRRVAATATCDPSRRSWIRSRTGVSSIRVAKSYNRFRSERQSSSSLACSSTNSSPRPVSSAALSVSDVPAMPLQNDVCSARKVGGWTGRTGSARC